MLDSGTEGNPDWCSTAASFTPAWKVALELHQVPTYLLNPRQLRVLDCKARLYNTPSLLSILLRLGQEIDFLFRRELVLQECCKPVMTPKAPCPSVIPLQRLITESW